ncbi:hypothetical protein [Evansella tamaricis]|uniref:Uncharacterized protein n=1 Tax=Evansella tamaricis TaxID=2069301 RepID=A0ABS6JLB7_9BACI|nr:hypothetical protein [Evansella tamaricis]MBU9714348.1 hypothetical protein [Evansella tamaricis]
MNDFISSYVIRIIRTESNHNGDSYRIKLSHVQSGEETYLHSFDEVRDYLEASVSKSSKEFGHSPK